MYNIGTYAYTLASTNRFNDILTPKCTSYHKCFEYQKQLTAVLGTTDDLGNPTELNIWNFEDKLWSIVPTNIEGRSRAVADMIGTDIIYIGGEEWNTHTTGNVNVIDYNHISM